MDINPFRVQGGVVPRGTKPASVDNASLIIIYNQLMDRYYSVGRDGKNGIISKETAKYQLTDIVKQLTSLKMQRLNPPFRKQVEALLARAQNTLNHVEEIETIVL